MLELQSDFGPLLRQAAIFESIGKLIRLSDSHQKLRLGQKRLRLHAILFRRRGQRREVHVRREVLLTRGCIGIGSGRVLTVCHQGPTMAPAKLLRARVTVVDRDNQSLAHRCGEARHIAMREQRDLDPLSRLGMNPITVNKFQFFSGRWNPGFDEAVVLGRDAKCSLRSLRISTGSASKNSLANTIEVGTSGAQSPLTPSAYGIPFRRLSVAPRGPTLPFRNLVSDAPEAAPQRGERSASE